MPETSIDENLVVLVGTGMGDANQNAIKAAIEQCEVQVELLTNPFASGGIEARRGVKRNWPMDGYVWANNQYFRNFDHGKLAEGGCIQRGNGYLVVSDAAAVDEGSYSFGRMERDEIRDLVRRQFQEVYGSDTRIHVVHSGTFSSRTGIPGQGHIDYHTMLLPNSGIMLVDENHMRVLDRDNSYRAAAEAEGLKFITYNSAAEGRSSCFWPLNSLVIPKKNGDIVVCAAQAKQLQRVLADEGVRVSPVNIVGALDRDRSGEISCVTNIKYATDNVDSQWLLDMPC